MVAVLLAGCPAEQEFAALPPLTEDGQPMQAVPADPKMLNADGDRYFLVVRLRMATIEVPLGTASGTEEIWSYLDEEPVGAMRSAALTRNGLRIGVGRGDSWSDLAAVLKRMTGRKLRESHMLAAPGNPVPIVLKRRQGIQTIFTFHSDRTLSGADYPPGDNLLTVSCTLDQDDPSVITITGVPQVRSTQRKQKIVQQSTGFLMVAKPTLFRFRPLAFQIAVPSGDFIVVGPGSESYRPHSVGHHFVVREKEGMEFETVLVLMPEVFAAPLKK
ncbi:MAG: hypothetical protein SVT52_06965 [Planctomycetota bacterium]|nr:hypothetical protein [Planctomycetota bacterium]